ncbi:MAG TPA: serine/threonine protein phosphatase [Catenuloplanes sp.]
MAIPAEDTDRSHVARLARYGVVAGSLALLSDRRLGELVERATPIGSGIGGTSVLLEIEGTPVFAKRVALTDLERRPENVMSTANLFGLPTGCQYGIGGPGFGVWRELAANAMTTGWVLGGRSAGFPLMYHWRVLPGAVAAPAEHADVDRTVAYWDGSPAVRARIEAVAESSAAVVLFLEHLPRNLHEWLTAQVALGDDAVEAACAMVARRLRTDVAFMNANGLLHFDAHFGNVLTDGRRLYLADLGLATSPRFELSTAEERFLRRNASHDESYVTTELVNWLVAGLSGAADPVAYHREHGVEAIRRYAAGEQPVHVPPSVAALIRRHAPVAAVLNDFYAALSGRSRTEPYPAEEIARVRALTGRD